MEELQQSEFSQVFLNFGVEGVEAVIHTPSPPLSASSASLSPSPCLRVSYRMSGENNSTSFEQWTGRISNIKLKVCGEGKGKREKRKDTKNEKLRKQKNTESNILIHLILITLNNINE